VESAKAPGGWGDLLRALEKTLEPQQHYLPRHTTVIVMGRSD